MPALTTAQQVRTRIQDNPIRFDGTMNGDGTASAFQLQHNNITAASAYVNSPAGWSATGATFNASGFMNFDTVPTEITQFRIIYEHSTFSDDEISYFTAVGGSVNGAALQAVLTLMADSRKRARWMSPDGSQYDDNNAGHFLRQLYSALKVEIGDEDIGVAGGFNSWSLGQEDY